MKSLLLLVIALGVVHCGSNDSLKDAPNKNITTLPPSEPTNTPPPTTPSPTTTTKPNITTTTSSPSPLPSTTTIPNITTTAPSPTTVKPVPNFWTLTDPQTGEVCLLAKMHIQLDISYNDTSDKVKMAHITVPGDSHSSGSCNSSDVETPQILKLSWDNHTIQFTFEGNSTSKLFYLASVDAKIAVDNKTFPNIKAKFDSVSLVNATKMFETKVGSSFSCNPNTNLVASVDPLLADQPSHFSISELHFQAFRTNKDNNFSTAVYCENGDTPDLVPIFVGCALAVLVITVLVAYLYSRRKSQARGYLSM